MAEANPVNPLTFFTAKNLIQQLGENQGENLEPSFRDAIIKALATKAVTKVPAPIPSWGVNKRPWVPRPWLGTREQQGKTKKPSQKELDDRKERNKEKAKAKLAEMKANKLLYDPEGYNSKTKKNEGAFIKRFAGVDPKTGIPIVNNAYNKELNRYNQKVNRERVAFQLGIKKPSLKAIKALKFLGAPALIDFGAFHQAYYPLKKTISDTEVADFMAFEMNPWMSTHLDTHASHWDHKNEPYQTEMMKGASAARYAAQGGFI